MGHLVAFAGNCEIYLGPILVLYNNVKSLAIKGIGTSSLPSSPWSLGT